MSVARRTWYQLKWLRVFRSVVVTGIDSLFQGGYGSAMTELLLDKNSWDALCLRCGRCCFEKIEDERGRVTYTTTACRYLDLDSRQCKIFENRFRINRECIALTPELVRTLDWLPDDCGYRAMLAVVPPQPEDQLRKRKMRRRR